MSKQSSPSKPPASAAGPSKTASSSNTPGQPQGLKKLRKKKRAANLNRALDEFDDVDDNDLVAGPSKRRRIIEDYDDEGEGEGEGDVDPEVDGEGEGEGSEEDDDDVDPDDVQVRGNEVPKEADPMRLEKINTKRKKQAYYLREMCDAEQGKRYDAFVVTSIPKAAVTKLNRDMFDQPVKDDFASILGGLAKIFVAEVVELAKDIQEERGEKGPLTPDLLRLAKERMEDTGLKGKKGMFRR